MIKLKTLVIIIGVALISTLIILSVCWFVFERFKYHIEDKFEKTTITTTIKPWDLTNINLHSNTVNSPFIMSQMPRTPNVPMSDFKSNYVLTYFKNKSNTENPNRINFLKGDLFTDSMDEFATIFFNDNYNLSLNMEEAKEHALVCSLMNEQSIFVITTAYNVAPFSERPKQFNDHNYYIYRNNKQTTYLFLGKKLWITNTKNYTNYNILTIRGINASEPSTFYLILYQFENPTIKNEICIQQSIVVIPSNVHLSDMDKIIDNFKFLTFRVGGVIDFFKNINLYLTVFEINQYTKLISDEKTFNKIKNNC